MKKLSLWKVFGIVLDVQEKINRAMKDGGIDFMELVDIVEGVLEDVGIRVLNKPFIKL